MTTPPSAPPGPPSSTIHLGSTGPLDPQLVRELAAHGVVAQQIPEDTDPSPEIDIVLVLEPPSPLIGRCRGRWPVIVAVDDPRATDVSRLLRGGVIDVTRRPIRTADLVSRINRALLPPTGESDDEDDDP